MHEKTCIALAAAVLSLALIGGNPFLAPRSDARSPGMFALRAQPAASAPIATSASPAQLWLQLAGWAPPAREPAAAAGERANGRTPDARLDDRANGNASTTAGTGAVPATDHGDH